VVVNIDSCLHLGVTPARAGVYFYKQLNEIMSDYNQKYSSLYSFKQENMFRNEQLESLNI